MQDLLTPLETAHAGQLGWQVCHVFAAETEKWIVEVLPIDMSAAFSARATQGRVLDHARQGDAVAIRSLQLVMQSHTPKAKGKKR